MQVKIDTKEKFHVITPFERVLSATMTDGMKVVLLPYLENAVKNVVVNLENVEQVDTVAAEQLLQVQQEFYERNASFVTCCLKKEVEQFLSDEDLLDLLNTTPTESEAGDIVQMEEIERELMDGDEFGEE